MGKLLGILLYVISTSGYPKPAITPFPERLPDPGGQVCLVFSKGSTMEIAASRTELYINKDKGNRGFEKLRNSLIQAKALLKGALRAPFNAESSNNDRSDVF